MGPPTPFLEDVTQSELACEMQPKFRALAVITDLIIKFKTSSTLKKVQLFKYYLEIVKNRNKDFKGL